MNTFEKQMQNIPAGASWEERIKEARAIVRSIFTDDNIYVKGAIFRDNPDILKAQVQVNFFILDNIAYMFIEKFSNGSYAGAQLEKAINDNVSEILFTTFNDTTNLYAFLLNLIQEQKLVQLTSCGF